MPMSQHRHAFHSFGFLNVLLMFLLTVGPLIGECHAASEGAQGTIVFINGDRLSGQLNDATSETLTFVGTVTGTLSIKWNLVKGIEFANQTMVVTSSSAKVTLTLASMKMVGTEFLLTTNTGDVNKIPSSEFVSINPGSTLSVQSSSAIPTPLGGWRGMFKMDDSLVGATQKKYDLGATLHMARPTKARTAFKHQVSDVTLQASFGESSKPGASPVRTALYEGILQQNIYLTDKSDWYAFGLANAYHNLSLGMHVEQSYGGGIGWDSYHNKHVYGFAADIRYINEDIYAPGRSLKLAASALSEHYSYTFPWPKKKPINFYERITFIPAFNESRAFQVRGIAAFDLPLTPKFSIGLQETDDYLRNAPAKTNQNYSKVQFNLKYSIGAPL